MMAAVQKQRAPRGPLPIPAEDHAEFARLKTLVTEWSPFSPTAKAYWDFRADMFRRANRCEECGYGRRGRARVCRDCYRA